MLQTPGRPEGTDQGHLIGGAEGQLRSHILEARRVVVAGGSRIFWSKPIVPGPFRLSKSKNVGYIHNSGSQKC